MRILGIDPGYGITGVALIDAHMSRLEPQRNLLRRRLSRLGQDSVEQLLLLQEADMSSKGTGHEDELEIFPQVRQLLQEIYAENACLQLKDLAVNGKDLLDLGLPAGPQLGQVLNRLLEQVVEETLPNEKSALLQTAQALFSTL